MVDIQGGRVMKFKKIILFLTVLVMMIGFTACSPKNTADSTSGVQTSSNVKPNARIIIDSCGRHVEVPEKITKIAPSGMLAQIMLYSLCPDKLAGLSKNFSNNAKKYINKKYWNLPKFGQFYGKNVSLNMEALSAAAPDIIIDIGEDKPTEKKDMDDLEKQLGIPVVFVEATLKTMDKAYIKLGNITGDEKQAAMLSDYCRNTIDDVTKKSASIPLKDRISVYYALGTKGLNTDASGSIQADVIEAIGADNSAKIKITSSGQGSEVSMEQIMLWNPDVILIEPGGIYNTIGKDALWNNLKAVKSERYYEVPDGPFNWMGEPPSINRIIGLKWLGNLLYPKVYNYDMISETQTFYRDFYHIDLNKEQVKEILKNSTFKK